MSLLCPSYVPQSSPCKGVDEALGAASLGHVLHRYEVSRADAEGSLAFLQLPLEGVHGADLELVAG